MHIKGCRVSHRFEKGNRWRPVDWLWRRCVAYPATATAAACHQDGGQHSQQVRPTQCPETHRRVSLYSSRSRILDQMRVTPSQVRLNVPSRLPGSHVLLSDRTARSESGAPLRTGSSLTCGEKRRSIAEADAAYRGPRPNPTHCFRCIVLPTTLRQPDA